MSLPKFSGRDGLFDLLPLGGACAKRAISEVNEFSLRVFVFFAASDPRVLLNER